MTAQATPRETPTGAWKITFLLFLFMLVNFADKIVVGLAGAPIMDELKLTPEQCCFIGDDLTDLPVIRQVGLGVAVADAATEVRAAAQFVTSLSGGQGAVRELIEMLLKSKHRWDDLIRKYTAS